jgi:fatty acid desaturase
VNALPASHYVSALRPSLPADAFTPHASRLWLLALHLAVIVCGTALIATGWGGLPGALALSVLVGHGFIGMAFVGHELLHGAVLRSRRASHLVGWVALVPFTLSPRLWKAWHNRMHHGHTMEAGVDPDAYPTLAEFSARRSVRAMERFSVARGHWLAPVCFAAGFSIQSLQLLLTAHRRGYLSRKEHLLAIGESLLGVAGWTTLAAVIGLHAFCFAFLIPLLIANAVAMAYILTNHNLSPLTERNDPLLNSLSVTVPWLFDRLHARFGLHVEHHLFPAMSSAHLPKVRALLVERWPERYQSMPLATAVGRLFATPRIYRSPTVLVSPRTGYEATTLLPRSLEAQG